MRRLGFSAARDHASTPVARTHVSFSRFPTIALGELETAGRRSHARGVMPRAGSGSRRVSRHCWHSSAGHARTDQLRGAEFLTGELIEQRRLVVFQGPLQEPIGERMDVVPADLAIAEMRLDGEEMILPGLRPRAVGGEAVGGDGQLVRDKGHGVGGGHCGGHRAQSP